MKIAFQGYFLTKPYSGIGQYCLNLLKSLAKIDSENEYTIIVPEKIDLKFGKNFRVKIVPYKKIKAKGLQKLWWEQIQVADFCKKEGFDLIHFPYPANFWFDFGAPALVTVHDTIPWDRKEYKAGFLSRLKHAQSRRALKKAAKIITVSDSTANDLIKHIPSLKGKTETVYNAPSELFLKNHPLKQHHEILKKYNLHGKKYFLYVGGYDSRKNVEILAEAFLERIAPDYETDLVFVGDKLHISGLYKSLNYLTALTNDSSIELLKGKIRLMGFVSEDDLLALYSGAFGFLNTSLQEGFNIPLTEAAACKLPIICSDIPVHREILGNYAEFCDPLNKKEIAAKMEKLCADDKYHQKLKQKSEHYVLPYNWDLSAKKVKKIYEYFSGSGDIG